MLLNKCIKTITQIAGKRSCSETDNSLKSEPEKESYGISQIQKEGAPIQYDREWDGKLYGYYPSKQAYQNWGKKWEYAQRNPDSPEVQEWLREFGWHTTRTESNRSEPREGDVEVSCTCGYKEVHSGLLPAISSCPRCGSEGTLYIRRPQEDALYPYTISRAPRYNAVWESSKQAFKTEYYNVL